MNKYEMKHNETMTFFKYDEQCSPNIKIELHTYMFTKKIFLPRLGGRCPTVLMECHICKLYMIIIYNSFMLAFTRIY